jgi:hypothetical protein
VNALSDYWKKKLEELNQDKKTTTSSSNSNRETKKVEDTKSSTTSSTTSSGNYWKDKLDELNQEKKSYTPTRTNVADKITVGKLSSGSGQQDKKKLTDEVSQLSSLYDSRKKERDSLVNQLNIWENPTTSAAMHQNESVRQRNIEYLRGELAKYDDLEELGATLSQKQKQLQDSQDAEDFAKLVSVVNSEDFEKYSTIGKNIKNPEARTAVYLNNPSSPDYGKGSELDSEAYETGNKVEWERAKGAGHIYQELTEDEVAIYNYYLGKGDKESADRFLELMDTELKSRSAESAFEDLKGKTAAEILYGGIAGLDQFVSGVANLGNMVAGKDETAPSFNSMLAGMVREDLGDDGPKILGLDHSLGQIGFDIMNTGANMAPSIAVSALSNVIVPGSGAVVGSALMGGSASGNAYKDALSQGYEKEEARNYAILVGASEAALQNVLGGIGRLGGTSQAINKAVSGIKNGGLRFLAEYGGKIGSEALEEGLQEVLDPLFKNAVMGADEDVDWEEVGYSALLGGFMGAGFGASEVKQSHLSNNEQKVVNQIYEDRVAREEKNGKVSNSKKSKIYEKVLNDMEKGRISADEIESVLGGESYNAFKAEQDKFFGSDQYKAYQKAVKDEKAARDEFDPLVKMKQGEMTGEQVYRRDELKKLLDESKVGEMKSALSPEADRIIGLRNQMRSQVMDMVKDSRLAESYRELERKSQKFEVDVSKYKNENAKKTVQSILDSGLGDNTNQFHETVDWLASLSEQKGITFDLTNNKKLKGTQHYKEGYITHGFVNDNGDVMLNMDSDRVLETTVGHEITHVLEKAGIYADLSKAVRDFAISKEGQEAYNKRLADIKEIYGEDQTKIDSELTADIIGQYLFTDYDFVHSLSTQNRNVFQKIYDEIKYLAKLATAGSKEARDLEKVKKMFDKAWRENVEVSEATDTEVDDVQHSISVDDSLGKDILDSKSIQYSYSAIPTHKQSLEKNFDLKNASMDLETINQRYDKIIDIWERLGGELDSKFLNDWNNKVERPFTIFKAQSGYKYNVELSSMCKKGVPLFEAIDTIVKKEVMKELDMDVMGKEEKEILYDILKQKHFEIPCAICYVEQARQREGVIIDAFLNGKSATDKKGADVKLGWNQVLDSIQKEMKANGVNHTFNFVSRDIATDKYIPADSNMDEQTYAAFAEAVKKLANEEITRYNKANGKHRPLLKDVTPEAVKECFKGGLPSNLKIFKVLLTEPSSRFKIQNDLLYSSMTTKNLTMAHNGLYSLFNSQGGVSGYKTKQAPTVYWGEILNKKWTPEATRKEGGIRNQSNSDFQMYTLLDQAQMYMDFSAKGYYLQAYTKVLSELKLFGLSRGKINASLIPQVKVYRNADGTVDVEKTMENAGLDENGNPIYDDIEGINHNEAFMLLEDPDYSKNIGGICIGYSDNHIRKLLDDSRVQLIIGFHDKTNDPNKRYRGARYAKNYNGLNEATKTKADGSSETVHIGFNPFVKKAENKFQFNEDTETFEGTVTYKGKTYTADDIPRLATDLYLEHCAKKGLTPAYNEFSGHENYYKLLADFSLYDSEGHYAPHQKVAYNMPDSVPYLDADGNKQYMSSEDYIKIELQKELAVRDSLIDALADDSEDGIIPRFKAEVEKRQIAPPTTQYSLSKDTDGNNLTQEQKQLFKDTQTVDENGNLKVLYHGSRSEAFTEFDLYEGVWLTTDPRYAEVYAGQWHSWRDDVFTVEELRTDLNGLEPDIYSDPDYRVYKMYANIKNPADIGELDVWLSDAKVRQLAKALGMRYTELKPLADSYMEEYTYMLTRSNEFIELAKSKGFDGFKATEKGRETWCAFASPDQVKLTSNASPTGNPDIRFSVSKEAEELGEGYIPVRDIGVHDEFEDFAPIRDDIQTTEDSSVVGDELTPTADESAEVEDEPAEDIFESIKGLKRNRRMSVAGHTIGMYTRNGSEDIHVHIKKPNGETIEETIAGGKYWTNTQLQHEIAKMITDEDDIPIKTVKERLTAKRSNSQTELDNNRRLRAEASKSFDEKIAKAQAQLDSKKNKETKVANNIRRRIERLQRLKADVDAQYAKRISDVESRITKTDVELQKDHTKQDQYERTITRINRMLELEKADLDTEFAQKREAIADKNSYISEKASELYKEIRGLKKGVKASEQLGYLLDHGYDWSSIRSALVNIKHTPGEIVNINSEAESVAREMLEDDYEQAQFDLDEEYQTRLSEMESEAETKRQSAKVANQRMVKHKEYAEQMENLIGDTTTWVDKKMGISYKVNTLRRNLRDIVRDAEGNRDIAKADAIYDELQGKYNHNEAMLHREANAIKSPYADLKITDAEDAYIQMLGELRHNPDTELTADAVNEFYEANKNKIDTDKVDKVIESARATYDTLLQRVNEVLREQGMKEIPYRQGYFPHFTDPKQSWLAKLLNWKVKDFDIPTDIAGLTEQFNPNRSWQAFNKQRKSDTTDYSFKKGLDTYVQGALDWVYHIEDIQKRRAFENHIRYVHSEKGIQERIDVIRKNTEYDADEMQEQIDLIYKEAGNPLNNFVTDFRAGTNTLANKKSSLDRGMEELVNRKVYSTMTNLSNRVSGNMVAGSFSSALTNFIPITQSWVEVSPVSSLRAMGDTIKSAVRDDGTIDKSDFLTNRLRQSESLYQTNWDKVSDKVGFLMEAIDSFTSQTVWRSKYLENISNGMGESEAIKNADQFAENVIAGRSRGNMPTIFDSKNPLIKTLTAFQLEVNNQYQYLLKDAPQDIKDKSAGKLIKGYATAFLGAYAYNALYSSLVGRDAAFDPIGILEELFKDLFGDDDDEEPVDALIGLTDNILEEVPFVGGLLGGGRIPISSALPYDGVYEAFKGTVEDVANKDWKNLTNEWLNPLWYLAMPLGGGQLRKTVQGLSMFDDDLPISGSYTSSGKLRFPVEDTFGNRVKAGLFGQYASKNARDYFDNGRSPLGEEQIQEFIDVDIPIRDYWEYREGLRGIGKLGEKADYIDSLDLPIDKKNLLINNIADREDPIDLTGYGNYGSFEEFELAKSDPDKYRIAKAVGGYDAYQSFQKGMKDMTLAEKVDYVAGLNLTTKQKNALINGETDRKEPIDLTGYEDFDSFEEFEFAKKNPEKYQFFNDVGISYAEYDALDEDGKDAYTWAFKNPNGYIFSKAVSDDLLEYRRYAGEIYDIKADKDKYGKSISGTRKTKVIEYLQNSDLDDMAKIILYKSEYPADDTYNYRIAEYLIGRKDLTYEEKKTILEELDFRIDGKGNISW